MAIHIVWFHQDLRVIDHPALLAAVRAANRGAGGAVVALFVLDEDSPGIRPWGGASRWWLHHSLTALQKDLADFHIPLILRRGAAERVIADICSKGKMGGFYWSRLYDPASIARDRAIKQKLRESGIEAESFNGSLLREPWQITGKSSQILKVFTPYFKALQALGAPDAPLPAPSPLPPANMNSAAGLACDKLEDWALLPQRPDWAGGLRAHWIAGEQAAQKRLSDFLDTDLQHYQTERDYPAREAVSRLSPHLHWGEISPRQVWHMVDMAQQTDASLTEDQALAFQRQLVWRDFSHAQLYQAKALQSAPLDARFIHFPWREEDRLLHAWQKGQTGYPLVDAAMKQLWQEGWMHNRLRMVCASFLVKHLLQPWQRGEEWFWDTLCDANAANNGASWQWVAGCGADAAPFFRIFNPILQSRKFDPQGDFIRRYLPELAGLDDKEIHTPWLVDAAGLKQAGILLGETYPRPIVDHDEARKNALAAWDEIKSASLS